MIYSTKTGKWEANTSSKLSVGMNIERLKRFAPFSLLGTQCQCQALEHTLGELHNVTNVLEFFERSKSPDLPRARDPTTHPLNI